MFLSRKRFENWKIGKTATILYSLLRSGIYINILSLMLFAYSVFDTSTLWWAYCIWLCRASKLICGYSYFLFHNILKQIYLKKAVFQTYSSNIFSMFDVVWQAYQCWTKGQRSTTEDLRPMATATVAYVWGHSYGRRSYL